MNSHRFDAITDPDNLVRHLKVAVLAREFSLGHLEALALEKFESCVTKVISRGALVKDKEAFTICVNKTASMLYPPE